MALNLLRNARLFISTADIAEATFTATISGTTMTVSAMKQGTIVSGRGIFGNGITQGTTITAFGTGTGGVGTYTISASHTIGTATTITSGTFATKSNTWEIPILGDFTFSQASETQDITVNEAGAAPVRGAARFNTALNPVEWSFSSYMRLYKNNVPLARTIDRILWQGLLSDNSTGVFTTAPFSGTSTLFQVDFSDSNVHKFTELYMLIKADNTWYKINGGQVNQAEIDFSIDTIGQITWSGFGKELLEVSTFPSTATAGNSVREYSTPLVGTATAVSATGADADFIIQKYTTMYLTQVSSINSTTNVGYQIPITGGSITINNNMSYLTPENLGYLNKPISPITGTRDISGSVTCYLKTGETYNDAGELLSSLQSNTSSTTNSFEINFNAGGNSAPFANFNGLNTMLSIPTVDVQDVISLNVDFKALPYTDTSITVDAGNTTLINGSVYLITTLGTVNWAAIGSDQTTAGSFIPGKRYIINSTGTTNFTLIGASASTPGTSFVATGAGAGTGTALSAYFIRNAAAVTGAGGTVTSRRTDLEAGSPKELVMSFYPATTTSDTVDAN